MCDEILLIIFERVYVQFGSNKMIDKIFYYKSIMCFI